MSCYNPCNSNTAIEQAVDDALADRIIDLDGYTQSSKKSAAQAAASATDSAQSAEESKGYRDQAQQVANTATGLVPDLLETSSNLKDVADTLEVISRTASSFLVRNVYYTVVGGENTYTFDEDQKVSAVQAIYIEGVRQDAGQGFVYDAPSRTITFAETFTEDQAGSVITIQVGQTNADSPETVLSALAGNGGASLVGTMDNISVQQKLDQLDQADADFETSMTQELALKVNKADLLLDDGATNVNFRLPGSGTIKRKLSDRLSDRISLHDFGAVGDGVTDDTAAVKAAFAYAASKTRGCTIDILDGNYLIKEEIVADGGNVQIYLNGTNSGGCFFVWPADSVTQGLRLGTVTPISRFSIYGLTFVTNAVTTVPAVKVVFNRASPKSLIFQDVSAYGGSVGGVAANGYWAGGLCQAKDPVYPIYEHCYFFGIGGPESVAKSNLITSSFLIQSSNGIFFNNFRNCFANNVNNAVWFITKSTPGIEGTYVESCNFNGVNIGVMYEAQDSGNAGYYPPQLFINNTQIEYLQRAVSVRKAGKFSSRGNLFYADPLNDEALTHILLTDVESAIITDTYMETRPVHTKCDGVVLAGACVNVQVRNNHIKIPANRYAVVFGGTSSNCKQTGNLVLGGNEYANTSTNKASNTAENYVINGERSTVLPDGSVMKAGSRVVTLGTGGSFTLNWVSPFPNGINTCLPHNGDSAVSTGAVTPTVFNATGMTGVVSGGTSGSSARINYMAVGF